ncbi:hypothetical protein RND81_12G242300 [Saponaria officinalis]|uniref:Uncharacterized protein n=1 Tax=Saponaria officinalis TaxID=3572 RepID=A0AAW1HF13_SAPOF
MTEVVGIQSSCGSSIQNTSSNSSSCRPINDGLYQQHCIIQNLHNSKSSLSDVAYLQSNTAEADVEEEEEVGGGERKRRRQQQHQQQQEYEYEEVNNFVGLFVTAFRRSVFRCSSSCDIITNTNKQAAAAAAAGGAMEIGVPTNVRHVAHVTFDRFNGFLGLPLEFQPEVPTRPPSASTTVFGVSTNSMQLSFDTRGNSVPTILLMMQHRLYALGGLQAEGIFRINPDNGQEESVRDQLNRGLLPEDVDVHSLAGLIKAWFRELPTGVLDCLSSEQVLQSQTEEECTELARLLPPTEFALLDWAINLMSDVAQFEHLNKMNARNIAMVFAPNMTHMADPLTALMHAVQVMNFLKTLIEKTLREREDSIIESALDFIGQDPSSGDGHHYTLQTILEEASEADGDPCVPDNPVVDQDDSSSDKNCKKEKESFSSDPKNRENIGAKSGGPKCSKIGQTSIAKKAPLKDKQRHVVNVARSAEKAKGNSLVSSMNLRSERIEAWR